MFDNELLVRAMEIAVTAHADDFRKGTGKVPYVVHPFEVAMILKENGMEDEVIAAGLLHDTLEDTKMTVRDLERLFGKKILEIVLGASEKLEDRDNTAWEDRKTHTIDSLIKANFSVKAVACADKLSNVRSMIRDFKQEGEDIWQRFNRGKEKQEWYYRNIIRSLEDLTGLKMYNQLVVSVDYLFNDLTKS